MEPHPIRVVVEDDLERSRLTVFLRLILAIPHLIWITLWGIAVFFVAILSWFVVLITGLKCHGLQFLLGVRPVLDPPVRLPLPRSEPVPGVRRGAGSYPIDLEVTGPGQQSRWKTAFRLLLALPAFMLSGALAGFSASGGSGVGRLRREARK